MEELTVESGNEAARIYDISNIIDVCLKKMNGKKLTESDGIIFERSIKILNAMRNGIGFSHGSFEECKPEEAYWAKFPNLYPGREEAIVDKHLTTATVLNMGEHVSHEYLKEFMDFFTVIEGCMSAEIEGRKDKYKKIKP